MSEQTTQTKKITVGLILSWVFGVFFALTGITSVFSEPIPGLIMLIMAAVLLPSVNELVDEKWKFHLSKGMKIVVTIIGFIILGSTIDTSNVTKQQNNQSQAQQEQKQFVSQDGQLKDEITSTKEQSKTTKNEQPTKTKKAKIIPISNTGIKSRTKELPTETKSDLETRVDSIIENHCQSEWSNNAKMKTYCKEQQYKGLTTLNLGKPSSITEDQFSIIRDKCKNEWSTDFKMRAYCEGQQYDGVRTLNNGKPADINDTEFNIVRPKCEGKWLADFKMRAYCESQQYDAVRTLNQGRPVNVSESDFKSARSSCANEWPTDYKMRVYCENQKY